MPLPIQLKIKDLNLASYSALVLHGSYARGDQTPASDVDLHVIVPDAPEARFEAREVKGFQVEIHTSTPPQILARLEQKPAWAHSWVRAEHLDGEVEVTEMLRRQAQAILAAYRPAPQEIEGIKHWLASAQSKMTTALERHDILYAGYLVNTNTWELLSALWYLNHFPIPASSLMFKLTPQLDQLPPAFAQEFAALCGGEGEGRALAFLRVSRWVLKQLTDL